MVSDAIGSALTALRLGVDINRILNLGHVQYLVRMGNRFRASDGEFRAGRRGAGSVLSRREKAESLSRLGAVRVAPASFRKAGATGADRSNC